MIGMGTVSVSNIKNGKDGATGMGIESTYVQYCYGASGTNPPGEYLVDENGNYLVDQNGNYFTNGQWRSEVPKEVPGLFLWSKTVTIYEDGTESVMYSLGKEGTGIISQKRLYYLSSSLDGLQDGFWTEEQPYPIPDGYYLWGRYEFIMSDGSVKYTNPVYEKTLSGVISEVDNANLQIRNKVWEEDTTRQINEWDTTNEVRTRIANSVQDINGIWTSITDENVKTVEKSNGEVVTTIASRLNEVKSTATEHTRQITQDILGDGETSLKSIATQTADHLSWIVDSGTSKSDFTLTSEAATLVANYINLNSLVTFNGLNSTVQSKITKPETLLKTWTGDANLATTTINGGYIRSHTIVADHLATYAIMSFGQQNQQTGEYTGGYLRDKNATFSTRGSFFDMENGNIFTPTFSIINTIPTGETNLKTGGFFKGNVVADTGNIGGWTIDGNLLYSVAKTPGSTSMILTPTGVTSTTSIGGSTGSKTWALTIKDRFGVTNDGYMYATNADISGKITSTSGSIGGININNIGIYTGTKSAANSTQDGFLISNTGAIYLGAYNSTRNSTAFQVNPNGYVKAYNLDALGGNVGGWTITDTMLYYNSATSSNPTRPSTTSIILSPRGNTPNPVVDVGGSGTATKNWGMTIGTGFGVTTGGELWCNQAHVTGTIFATAGKIGDCEIINGHLNVASATIDEIDGSKITAGTITADRININNLGDLSTALGSITSGSMAWSSGSGSSYTAFGVNSNGKLTATSAEISGTLTAGAGSKIGPWLISATSISKNNGDNNTVGVGYCTPGDGNMYFGDDGISISNVFYVSKTGKLTSTSAEITGSITADTLKFKDSNTGESSNIIKATAIEDSETVDVRIGQNGTTGTYIKLCYAGGNEYGSAITDPGQIKISAPNGLKIVNDTDVDVDGNVELLSGYTLGADYIDVDEITVGTSVATIKSESLEDGSPRIVFDKHIKATDIYATGSYRIFYWKDSSHPNATLQCVETNTPNYFGNPKGIQGTQATWIRFGSTHSDNCMAMPIGGSDIFFHVGSSWYKLKEDIIDKLGTGGGSTTTISPYTNTPSSISSSGSAGSSDKYARGDHTHAISVGSGTSSGQIQIAGQNVTVTGFSSLESRVSTLENSGGSGSAEYPKDISCSSIQCTGTINTKNATVTGQLNVGSKFIVSDGKYIEYDAPTTSSDTANVTLVSSGNTDMSSKAYRFKRVTSSSKRYKDHVKNIDIEYARKILDIPVVSFIYKDWYLSKDDRFFGRPMSGLYAEDVEKYLPEGACYNPDGTVENWRDRTILTLLLRVVQDQQKRIEELEKKLAQ